MWWAFAAGTAAGFVLGAVAAFTLVYYWMANKYAVAETMFREQFTAWKKTLDRMLSHVGDENVSFQENVVYHLSEEG